MHFLIKKLRALYCIFIFYYFSQNPTSTTSAANAMERNTRNRGKGVCSVLHQIGIEINCYVDNINNKKNLVNRVLTSSGVSCDSKLTNRVPWKNVISQYETYEAFRQKGGLNKCIEKIYAKNGMAFYHHNAFSPDVVSCTNGEWIDEFIICMAFISHEPALIKYTYPSLYRNALYCEGEDAGKLTLNQSVLNSLLIAMVSPAIPNNITRPCVAYLLDKDFKHVWDKNKLYCAFPDASVPVFKEGEIDIMPPEEYRIRSCSILKDAEYTRLVDKFHKVTPEESYANWVRVHAHISSLLGDDSGASAGVTDDHASESRGNENKHNKHDAHAKDHAKWRQRDDDDEVYAKKLCTSDG